MYCMFGWPPGGSAGTSFCSGTEMSISWRAMADLPILAPPIVSSLSLGVKEARAKAPDALIVGREQVDQYFSLRRVGAIRGDTNRIHGRQPVARRKRSGQGDARGTDDLGCLRAADRPFRVGGREMFHRGRPVCKDFESTRDLIRNAYPLKNFCNMNAGGRCLG